MPEARNVARNNDRESSSGPLTTGISSKTGKKKDGDGGAQKKRGLKTLQGTNKKIEANLDVKEIKAALKGPETEQALAETLAGVAGVAESLNDLEASEPAMGAVEVPSEADDSETGAENAANEAETVPQSTADDSESNPSTVTGDTKNTAPAKPKPAGAKSGEQPKTTTPQGAPAKDKADQTSPTTNQESSSPSQEPQETQEPQTGEEPQPAPEKSIAKEPEKQPDNTQESPIRPAKDLRQQPRSNKFSQPTPEKSFSPNKQGTEPEPEQPAQPTEPVSPSAESPTAPPPEDSSAIPKTASPNKSNSAASQTQPQTEQTEEPNKPPAAEDQEQTAPAESEEQAQKPADENQTDNEPDKKEKEGQPPAPTAEEQKDKQPESAPTEPPKTGNPDEAAAQMEGDKARARRNEQEPAKPEGQPVEGSAEQTADEPEDELSAKRKAKSLGAGKRAINDLAAPAMRIVRRKQLKNIDKNIKKKIKDKKPALHELKEIERKRGLLKMAYETAQLIDAIKLIVKYWLAMNTLFGGLWWVADIFGIGLVVDLLAGLVILMIFLLGFVTGAKGKNIKKQMDELDEKMKTPKKIIQKTDNEIKQLSMAKVRLTQVFQEPSEEPEKEKAAA